MSFQNEDKDKIRELYQREVAPDLWREETLIFSAGGNHGLAQEIADLLDKELHRVGGFFPDTDPKVKFGPNVRGKHVILIQPTVLSGGILETDGMLANGRSSSDNLMLLIACCDAFKRASADKLTLVIPSMGGTREDRKSEPHVPITASIVANMITEIGRADRVVTVDLHSGQIQGMFKPGFPVDNLYTMPLLIESALQFLKKQGVPKGKISLGAPDLGVKVLRSLGKVFGLPIVQYDKERLSDKKARMSAVVGKVRGRYVILIDDLLTTFGTMVSAIETTYDLKAKMVIPCAVHAIIVGSAIKKIRQTSAPVIFITNSVEWRTANNHKPRKVRVVSVAPLIAEVIVEIVTHGSVSKHFSGIKD